MKFQQPGVHCRIKESLLIKDLKPSLNKNVGSEKRFLYQPFYFPADFDRSVYYQFFTIVLIRFENKHSLDSNDSLDRLTLHGDIFLTTQNEAKRDIACACNCDSARPRSRSVSLRMGSGKYRSSVTKVLQTTGTEFISPHSLCHNYLFCKNFFQPGCSHL